MGVDQQEAFSRPPSRERIETRGLEVASAGSDIAKISPSAQAPRVLEAQSPRGWEFDSTLEAVRQAAEQVVGQPLAAAAAMKIARYCARNQLDPYEDVTFIRTRSGIIPIVTRAAWLRRVARDPAFTGLESGVLVSAAAASGGAGSQVDELPGAFCPPGHRLLGAWARIRRCDRTVPTYCRVSAAEYADKAAQPGTAWSQYPATMLVKVAQVHACREAFPDLGGAYDESEFPNAQAPRGWDNEARTSRGWDNEVRGA
jgi:hypothetical protein